MQEFMVEANDYLKMPVRGFYSTDYVGFYEPGNPSYLNTLKNQFASYDATKLKSAILDLGKVLLNDLPKVFKALDSESLMVCVMPRSKINSDYVDAQLLFAESIRAMIAKLGGIKMDPECIVRHTSTRTTHIRKPNGGANPYPGITLDTCHISDDVRGKDILLIDDIYTKTVNVNEDAIQALLDKGAKSVSLYVVAKTKKKF